MNLGEVQKPRRGRNEPARVVVERREMFVKIHLHPLASGLLRVPRSDADEFGADTTPLVIGTDFRVNQKRVVAAVPRDVHKPDKTPRTASRSYPAEAVWADAVPPSRLCRTAMGLRERDEFVVCHLSAPCELHVCERACFPHHGGGVYAASRTVRALFSASARRARSSIAGRIGSRSRFPVNASCTALAGGA